MDERLLELAGGSEQIQVIHQVPWRQNYVLAGTSKSRVTCDSLSTFQWMTGFCSIIKEEKDKVKNAMFEYFTDKVPMHLSSVGYKRVKLIDLCEISWTASGEPMPKI